MAYTDSSLVQQIGTKIKLYRKISHPNMNRMDFYEGITLSEDRARKIEAGRCMPDFDFLIKLSKQYHLPVDYFTESGFRIPDSALDIVNEIDELTRHLSFQCQYEFLQKMNLTKYWFFTKTNCTDLSSTSMNETDKKLRGNLLKNARIKHNVSLEELSAHINRSVSTIQRMEAGSGESSSYIWVKISRQFRIPMDLFLVNQIKNCSPNLELVLHYLICDTFLGLTPEDRSLMLSLVKNKLNKKCKA